MTDIVRKSRGGTKHLKISGFAFMGLCLLMVGFAVGRFSAKSPTNISTPSEELSPLLVQLQPDDPRELLPLPGQGEGEGQGLAPGECPIYLYQDGQLFQLQPGQPLPGQPGAGGGSPELIPLDPAPGSPPSFPVPAPPSLELPRYAESGAVVMASSLHPFQATR